jgi:cytochrome c556
MPPKILALSLALAATAGLAHAQPQIPAPAPADYAQIRQASVDMSVILRDEMNRAMKEGRDAKSQAYAAFAFARWTHVLPTLFPTGSGPGETRTATQARPTVWTDRPGFLKAAANFAAAADKLSDLAKANDTEGFKAQLVVMQQACDACHATYKAGMQRAPNRGTN